MNRVTSLWRNRVLTRHLRASLGHPFVYAWVFLPFEIKIILPKALMQAAHHQRIFRCEFFKVKSKRGHVNSKSIELCTN